MEDCTRAVLKEKNDNLMDNLDNEIITEDQINPTELINTQNITNVNDQVEIGNFQHKVTISRTKTLNEENEDLKCNDENNILKKTNINVENNCPDDLQVQKPNSSPLPDIVNVLPTITVNESPNQIYKEGRIISNILHGTEHNSKTNIPSGPSSSLSSDDELFVECETYSITDKTQQLSSSTQNDINFPMCQNEGNVSRSETKTTNGSNWKNVLSSLYSQNVENLENSKIHLDISPQILNSCLDTTNTIISKHEKIKIANTNVDQIMEEKDSDGVQNIHILSLKEISHQNIIENRMLDTTFENPEEIINQNVIESGNRTVENGQDTIDTSFDNNSQHEKIKIANTNVDQIIEEKDSDGVQNIHILSLKEISHQNIIEIEKRMLDTTFENPEEIINQNVIECGNRTAENGQDTIDTSFDNPVMKESDNTIDTILCEQIANLQLSNFSLNSTVVESKLNSTVVKSNSLISTVVESKDSETSEINLISTVNKVIETDSIEAINNLNLTTDTEMLELSHVKQIISDDNLPLSKENLINETDEIENSIPKIKESKAFENMELISKSEECANSTLSQNCSESKSIDNLENRIINHNLTVPTNCEEKILPNIGENRLDNSIDISNVQVLNKTRNISESQELPEMIITDNLENDPKFHNVNESVTVEDKIVSTDFIWEQTIQKINLNETHEISQSDIEKSIISNPDVDELNNVNSDKNNIMNNNELVKIPLSKELSNATDEIKKNNLNLTIDITDSINDPKIISKKSPVTLETIYEATPTFKNLDETQNLSLTTITERSKSINELNTTCDINIGQSLPNLNFVDSTSQGYLNTTFAASVEALNSTINVPMAKNSNLPIISSPVDSQKSFELHENEENQNYELKEDDFQSNGMILNPWDFDFLLTKGNNNNIQVQRNSLLLKFDPLLGKPQPQQQEIAQHQQKFNQEFCPLSSVTSSQRRLSPAVEEEEYFDIVPKSSLIDIHKQENLIVTATGNSFTSDIKTRAIKTEPLEFRNKMSIDVVRDMKTENNFISSENDINSADVKYDTKMEDLEKKIQNEVLKKTEEIGKKLKEVEQREEALLRRITEKDKTTAKMGSVIEAYEKAIAEMIAEKEEITHNYERQLAEIKSERDLNYQHLASLESTFADLHVKYERSKQITAKLKANEEESCAARKQFLENLRLQEQRYEKMKNHAMQQLEIANNKLEFLTKNHSSEITKLKALLKKEEISKGSITEQLQQKTRENEELVKICDELINGQGS